VGRSHSARRRRWLTGGPSGTVPGGADSNWIQKYFKRIQNSPNFDCLKRCLPFLQKWEIKYGWKELEMRKNFA
jgi:hypothetical protein